MALGDRGSHLLVFLSLCLACGSAVRDPSATGAATRVARCGNCHGNDANMAPPLSVKGLTDTREIAVGAHQSHLRDSVIRGAIACSECHVVPDRVDAPGHIDKDRADVRFGPLASTRGATPGWDHDSATCRNVYCHGATLKDGGAIPTWTRVDGTQATCGTCHGVPPSAASGHPDVSGGPPTCASCHPDTVLPDGSIKLASGKHIDGVLDIGPAACFACHGNSAAGTPAPPRGTRGETDTSEPAVGAHQSHLTDGAVRTAIACDECHTVPTDLSHVDGTAELTWGPLAQAVGANPSWDRTTCANTYCHGATLSGGTNTRPLWTKVDGTQAACGTCHGVPPPEVSGHPKVSMEGPTACFFCHRSTVKPDGTIDVSGGQHINGTVEAPILSCTSCHGDPNRKSLLAQPAPPRGTHGETDTTMLAVGAHQQHLADGPMRKAIPCTECHVVPITTNHFDGVVTVVFGVLTQTGNTVPSWDPATATCSATYCHGATLAAGGTNQSPTWTRVDGTQAACGTCHGIPPPGGHARYRITQCYWCHGATVNPDGTIDVAGGKHINGVVDVSGGG